ncbi:MAG: tRNA (N6-isopentenyl adenosine(37)-C2)-methylthiotransferase MiaB [Firmicutes bacterium HGW-Firmicutes-1]|jgi:tRNA-2-methylthio-N6-dimethylallyladenosine synthase|nr:MAG: tRNA (N6-isopentenyl adenosine(37)-C2)-methylthiotransferase MiaB [Firmicutes bacterium HGW-Firmicutes-1]
MREQVTISHEEANRQKEIICRLSKKMKGNNLTYFITTLGCQMNAHDSEKLKGVLEEIGYTPSDIEEDADFVIYNTCCVRENAELKVYGRIGYLKNIKKKNPNMLIALCGCMMQQDTVVQKLKQSFRHIDLVFGTHNLYKVAELIETRLETGETIFDIWTEHGDIVEDLPSIRKLSFKASVNIMYGCNNFCSYCIVPYVRGRERSRTPEDIINEIRTLASEGVVEIMLLGQNVNSYGSSLDVNTTFATLLTQIEKIEGIERIRFMTSHPKDLSDELIEVMAKSTKLCDQLHLPFQSGSTSILEKMNRKYTKEHYLQLVDKVKKSCPDIALSTDIIVGFPGETEEDFINTLEVVESVGYDFVYTFIYSKRTGTPAAIMEEQIPEAVSKERFNRLLKLVNAIAYEKSVAHVGKVYDVLIEEVNQQNPSLVSGRLSNNHLVHLNGGQELIGKILSVKITSAKSFYLNGELV